MIQRKTLTVGSAETMDEDIVLVDGIIMQHGQLR